MRLSLLITNFVNIPHCDVFKNIYIFKFKFIKYSKNSFNSSSHLTQTFIKPFTDYQIK